MQVLDSLIEGPLRLRNRREGDELIGMIVRYLATGDEPEPRTDAQEAVITSVMPVLAKSRARIVAGSNGGSKAPSKQASKTASKTGSNGASDAASKQASKTASKTGSNGASDAASKAPSEEEEELGRGIRKDEAGEKLARFRAPALEEVAAYASEYCAKQRLDLSGFSAERFIDHYTANGWRVGRTPMKDWKATVRNWCRNDCKPMGGGSYAQYDR